MARRRIYVRKGQVHKQIRSDFKCLECGQPVKFVRKEGKIVCTSCGDALPVQIDLLTEEVDAYAQYIDAKLGTKTPPRKSNKKVFGDSFFD